MKRIFATFLTALMFMTLAGAKPVSSYGSEAPLLTVDGQFSVYQLSGDQTAVVLIKALGEGRTVKLHGITLGPEDYTVAGGQLYLHPVSMYMGLCMLPFNSYDTTVLYEGGSKLNPEIGRRIEFKEQGVQGVAIDFTYGSTEAAIRYLDAYGNETNREALSLGAPPLQKDGRWYLPANALFGELSVSIVAAADGTLIVGGSLGPGQDGVAGAWQHASETSLLSISPGDPEAVVSSLALNADHTFFFSKERAWYAQEGGQLHKQWVSVGGWVMAGDLLVLYGARENCYDFTQAGYEYTEQPCSLTVWPVTRFAAGQWMTVNGDEYAAK